MHVNKRMLRAGVAGTAIAAALVLTSCSGGGGSSSGAAVEGGSITMMSAAGVTSWDPALAFFGTLPGVTTDRFIAVYGQLFYVDQEGGLVPSLAESFSSDDGGTVWTLKLRDGIMFTDGTPYDAAAVKYNWDRIADPTTASPVAGLSQSFASTIVDDLTLTVMSAAPNPILDEQLAELMQLIASPTALEAETYTTPVGAGPFILTHQDAAIGEDLKANPDYVLGPPAYDELHFRTVGDPSQRVETIAAGDAQYMNGFSSDFRDYADNPGFSFYQVPNGGFRHLVFNNAKAPFNDVRARKAVAYALNPEELTQTLLSNPEQTGSTSLFPNDSPYYDPGTAAPVQDIDEAQSLVDELIADGVDMTFTIVAAAIPESIRAAEYVQLSLEALDGVTVNVEQVDIQDWRMRVQSNDDFDITFYLGIYDVNPVATTFDNLFEENGTDNIQNSSSPDMTAALTELSTSSTDDEKAAALAAIQKIYAEELPIYVFGYDYRVYFHEADVDGFTAVGRGAILPEKLSYTS